MGRKGKTKYGAPKKGSNKGSAGNKGGSRVKNSAASKNAGTKNDSHGDGDIRRRRRARNSITFISGFVIVYVIYKIVKALGGVH